MTIKVAVGLIGGSNLFRQGLRSYLDSEAFEIVVEAERRDDFLTNLPALAREPELLIYAAMRGDRNTAEAIQALRDAMPDAHVMVMAEVLETDGFADCLSAGVSGYLLADISKDALLHSMQLILLGEKVFATEFAKFWMEIGGSRPSGGARREDHNLTRRESEILECLLDGHSNKAIANRLGITESTVKIHMKSLLRKINVQNRTQAAIWAMETGFKANPMNA
jgi:two-component system nitrate/nitrite response regulator NarL